MPERGQTGWVQIEGTRTSRASLVPVLSRPLGYDTAAANVLMAYHAPVGHEIMMAEDIIRLDFLFVVEMRFLAFGTFPPHVDERERPYFALSVTDESDLKTEFLEAFPDHEDMFARTDPADAIRHFEIVFDNFGSYDILAKDCAVRTVHEPTARTSLAVLEAALSLGEPQWGAADRT